MPELSGFGAGAPHKTLPPTVLYTVLALANYPEIHYMAQMKHIAGLFIPSDHGHIGILQKGDRFNRLMFLSQVWSEEIIIV